LTILARPRRINECKSINPPSRVLSYRGELIRPARSRRGASLSRRERERERAGKKNRDL